MAGDYFSGTVYRAHNPRWSFAPDSGAGAAKHGGRFNRPGVPALYTSSRYELAIAEAHQGLAYKLQPLTIVSYAIVHESVLDLSTPAACDVANVAFEDLGCAWELIAYEGANAAELGTGRSADRGRRRRHCRALVCGGRQSRRPQYRVLALASHTAVPGGRERRLAPAAAR
ncbi:RES domain-containing protein [Salinisphaera sp. T5B8]